MLYVNTIDDSISTKWNIMMHKAIELAYQSKSNLANHPGNNS